MLFKTMNWSGLWVVEWSEEQKQFHLESAESRLKDSIKGFFARHDRGGWITLGVFNSMNEGEQFIAELRSLRQDT